MKQVILLLSLLAVGNVAPTILPARVIIDYDIARDGVKAANADNTNEAKLWEALGAYEMTSQMKWSFTALVPEQILQATSLGVAGRKYTWTVMLTSSNCGKDRQPTKILCKPDPEERKELYLVTFMDAAAGYNKLYSLERLDSREPKMTGKDPEPEDCGEGYNARRNKIPDFKKLNTTVEVTYSMYDGKMKETPENTAEAQLWKTIAIHSRKVNGRFLAPIKIYNASKQLVDKEMGDYIYRWTVNMALSNCTADVKEPNKDLCKPQPTKEYHVYEVEYYENDYGLKLTKIEEVPTMDTI